MSSVPPNNIFPEPPTEIEGLLNDSRIAPTGNGNRDTGPNTVPPTSGQKWWAAVLLGLVFAIISSPVAYNITNYFVVSSGGAAIYAGQGPTLAGLVIHTLIFILIVRLILW